MPHAQTNPYGDEKESIAVAPPPPVPTNLELKSIERLADQEKRSWIEPEYTYNSVGAARV